jgi:hypothetical protein
VKVRLKKPATLVAEVGHHWHPAGAEVEIPDEHFDPDLHEELLEADAAAAGPQPLEEDEHGDEDEHGQKKPRKRK